jgi:DNA-binding CsgD family transcriptional regulator
MLNWSVTQSLSKALLELHNSGPHTDFPTRLFASLRLCFSCDFYSFNEWTDKKVERIEIYPNWDLSLRLFKDYLSEHPAINAIYQKRLKSAVTVSDFVSLTQWRQARLYNELFRLPSQNYQLTFVSAEQLPRLAVSLNRASAPFSEEERTLLNLLRPHFVQAYRESRLFSYLNQAAEISNDGFIVVDRAWRIRYVNARGLVLLRDFFGQEPGNSLPARIGTWLQEKTRSRLASEPVADLIIASDDRSLTIQTVANGEGSEYRLLLRETVRQLDARPLQSLGLTNREAEVLLWLSQGKSNSEIAIILTTKVRTIAKHLERVFAKLMVENRTAAAHTAMEVLRA